jgi:hypothetical protein
MQTTAHTLKVKSLYRKALRSLGMLNCVCLFLVDHYWERGEMIEKQVLIRDEFDKRRNIKNPKLIERVLYQTERMISDYTHFQPYICNIFSRVYLYFKGPTAPGGSKWERNVPFPEQVSFFFFFFYYYS